MSRTPSKPLTGVEIADLQAFFKTLPTYRDEKGDGQGYILSSDGAELCDAVALDITPVQLQIYKLYWDKTHGGKIPLSACMEIINQTLINDAGGLGVDYAKLCDKDGNGYIELEELKELSKLLIAYDSRLGSGAFTDFVLAADTNNDGKVSIEECAGWIEQQIQTRN